METKLTQVTLKGTGKAIPVIGMGTASDPRAAPEVIKEAVLEAIKTGYRHFDTSYSYSSEKPLGDAIVEALKLGHVKSRDELFICTKLSCGAADPDLVQPAIRNSLKNLQLEYVDLYIIHLPLKLKPTVRAVPVAREDICAMDVKAVWGAMEECKNSGLAKAIGVSNFSVKKLQELLSFATIPPSVNQVEMSPLWRQEKLREFCKEKGIHITAYSPLGATGTAWGHNQVVGSDLLQQIAQAKGKTSAQIALRWVYEQGVSLVVKSYNKERMKQNIDIFDWCLTEEESLQISQLPQRKAVVFATVYGPHDVVLELDAGL